MQALLYKQLFLYLIPLNMIVGEYNIGAQYRFSEEWAFDINAGYVDDIEGSFTSALYQSLFKSGIFYYQGPFIKCSMISVIPRGANPLRTDYNQMEVSYRYLGYDHLDFKDESDPDKLFNITERMSALGFSWKAGYNMIPRESFEISGFVGFGLQLRFKKTTVNSYGYYYQSDQFPVNDVSHSVLFVPLFHAGIKVGYKTLEKKSID